jgi:RNA polymerase sigma factor (sigma-70 family)
VTPVRPGARLGRAALGCQPDSRLVALVREGSDRAFEEIVRRYRRRLVAYAAGVVGSDRAEDVVQESLVRALAAIRRRDAEISLRPWLYTIVRNRALNDRRDQPTDERLDEDYDGVPQPPEIAARREELAGVVDRVKALPEAQREALVQRELEGRSHDEIAAALTVTPGAVRGLIFRARAAVRDAAGLLIPMPVLRALAQSSAVGDGAALVAAGGGAGGLVKLGTALTIAAVTVGGGVALHDQGGKGDEAKADSAPAARSAAGPNGHAAGKAVPTAAGVEAGDDRGGGPGRDGGSDSSGHGGGGSDSGHSGSGSSGSSGSGSGGSGSGGSGSSGSTSDGGSTSSSGSGSSGSGSSGSGDGGGSGSGDDGSGSGSGSGSSGAGSGDSLSGSSGSGSSGTSNSGPGSSGGDSSGSGSLSSGSGSLSSGDGSSTTTTTTTTTTATTTTMTTDGDSSGSGSSGSGSSGSGSSGSGSSGPG